jgi:hypothetical protein
MQGSGANDDDEKTGRRMNKWMVEVKWKELSDQIQKEE